MQSESVEQCVTDEVDCNMVSVITEILRSGELSVSALTRELEARRGAKLHRLEVSGYLKAMKALGILDSKRIPPSLVFSLKEGGHDRQRG